MQSRYALRFENGERQGETIPITGSGVTVGRKPGNSVQILDASVSGRHAEFLVEQDGILLRDLGSTNGTRVGSERVSERKVAHGDQILLGNVRMVLVDSTLASSTSATDGVRFETVGVPKPPAASDEVRRISADKVERTAKRSLVGAIVLLALVVVGGAAGWWFFQQRGASAGAASKVRAVEPVEGNLLASGFSFEGDAAAWENDAAAPSSFDLESSSRRSGETGLGALVERDEWALARSTAVKPSTRGALRASGWLRLEGDVQARVGVELDSTTDAAARTLVWHAAPTAGGDFEAFEFNLAFPPSFDAARVVVYGRSTSQSGGSIDLDDVALVPAEPAAPPKKFEEFQLFAQGEPPSALVLFKIDRTLLSDVRVVRGEGAAAERVPVAIEAKEGEFSLGLGSGEGRVLSLRVDELQFKGGFATTGAGGYRTHSTEFAQDGATSLMCGAGKDLVRLHFSQPVRLRGAPEGKGFRVDAELATATDARLQLAFLSERDEAQQLARSARELEKQGRLGAAAAAWGRVRDEFPVDAALLGEADTTRSRIAEKGLAEARDLRREVERARFFRLVDLYRRCRSEAENVAQRYQGSEVEADVRSLVAEIETDLAALEVDLDRAERARLEGIATSLEAAGSAKLAARVRDYLAQHFATGSAQAAPGGGH